eukprot:GFUD01100609.1.p1 GENE.GFUD01100609.1~~GFUD01100609.1.p1  ORF type:complete len:149 (+),score=29.58 GFUD01100609.1:130-576(+)
MKQGPKSTPFPHADKTNLSTSKLPKPDKDDILHGTICRPHKKRTVKSSTVIHSLKETTKYHNQSSSSDNFHSPFYSQYFESEQTPLRKSKSSHNKKVLNVCELSDNCFIQNKRDYLSETSAQLPPVEDCDDISVSDLCHDLEKKMSYK